MTFWEMDGLERDTELRITFHTCVADSKTWGTTGITPPPPGHKRIGVHATFKNLGPRRIRGIWISGCFDCEIETKSGYRYPVSFSVTERLDGIGCSTWEVEPGDTAYGAFAFTARIPVDAKSVAMHGTIQDSDLVPFRLNLRGVDTTVPQHWINGKWPGT